MQHSSHALVKTRKFRSSFSSSSLAMLKQMSLHTTLQSTQPYQCISHPQGPQCSWLGLSAGQMERYLGTCHQHQTSILGLASCEHLKHFTRVAFSAKDAVFEIDFQPIQALSHPSDCPSYVYTQPIVSILRNTNRFGLSLN